MAAASRQGLLVLVGRTMGSRDSYREMTELLAKPWGVNMAKSVRNWLLVRTCLEVLQDAEQPLQPGETVERVGDRIGDFTPYERETLSGGRVRWQNFLPME